MWETMNLLSRTNLLVCSKCKRRHRGKYVLCWNCFLVKDEKQKQWRMGGFKHG